LWSVQSSRLTKDKPHRYGRGERMATRGVGLPNGEEAPHFLYFTVTREYARSGMWQAS